MAYVKWEAPKGREGSHVKREASEFLNEIRFTNDEGRILLRQHVGGGRSSVPEDGA